MKKIITMFVLVCLLSSALMGCGDGKVEETFETLNCEDGGFTVDFPGKPENTPQTIQTALGDIVMNTYMVEKEHIAYICTYNDYPEEFIKKTDTNELLMSGCNGAITNSNGKNEKITDITLGEYPGKDLIFEGEEDGNMFKIHQKIYIVGNRMYQLNIATDKEEENKENINKFFESFKLTSK
ncbi:hypothetical protein [Marinisporobacter balticus]|uniref:Lipoprotein n=1 Tax=Marinisporobacter balticus TaxID=2018667 RepID=A0A4R2KRD9_9FIRM|nr:hypothetical protein [Marinisporobacter balticus]TCO76851.1 hypothetical protein EV214_1077 [Marinisporobacter balticus]